MSKMDRIIRDLSATIRKANDKKTTSYDTEAEVRRIDGNTAWVHIDGGVDETPVKLTIDAKQGDRVQVRVGGGRAWITGNASSPPTDNSFAKRSQTLLLEEVEQTNVIVKVIDRAVQAVKKIADNTNQYFWHTEEGTDTGAHITEIPQEEFLADPDNGGGNLLMRSNGMAVRYGLAELASFGAGGAQIGLSTASHSVIDANGQRFYGRNGSTLLANIGYGEGKNGSGTTSLAPYYTFGTRTGSVGNFSFTSGDSTTASGYFSHAEGRQTTASGDYSHAEGRATSAVGDYSHAEGRGTNANGDCSLVIGTYNNPDTSYVQDGLGRRKYAFIIGNGDGQPVGTSWTGYSNAFAVEWSGKVYHAGDGSVDVRSIITRNSGATISNATLFRHGQLAMLYLYLTYNTSVAAGADVFTGTMADGFLLGVDYRPAIYTTGVGYYGARSIVGKIENNGTIVIRNASSSAVTLSDGVSVAFTYIIRD